MTRDNLSTTEKRRLEYHRICPICNKYIADEDSLLFTIRRKRRCKVYTFYHERCVRGWVKIEKELVD
jgi:hypothetical protein